MSNLQIFMYGIALIGAALMFKLLGWLIKPLVGIFILFFLYALAFH